MNGFVLTQKGEGYKFVDISANNMSKDFVK